VAEGLFLVELPAIFPERQDAIEVSLPEASQAHAVIQSFADYLRQYKDEIAALGFFYQQPCQRCTLTFEMLEELHERLSRPPLMLTTERLWNAYARVHASQVTGATSRRQLTDLVSLLRLALRMDGEGAELKPFAEEVGRRFQQWIFRHNAQRGTSFTPEQIEWLRWMRDRITTSCSISRDDFDYPELADKGGLQRLGACLARIS
jgi:type I restriction enzyme R subunit